VHGFYRGEGLSTLRDWARVLIGATTQGRSGRTIAVWWSAWLLLW